MPGLKNLMAETYPRLQRGRMAWLLMQEISQGNREPHVLQAFRELEGDLGYGMLLSRYAPVSKAIDFYKSSCIAWC